MPTRSRTAIPLGASKRCASSRRRRARPSTRAAALACDTARLPASLMALLKGPIPTFLTTPRSLLQVPWLPSVCAITQVRSCSRLHGPPSTAARRRAFRRRSSSAAQRGGTARLLRLQISKMVCCARAAHAAARTRAHARFARVPILAAPPPQTLGPRRWSASLRRGWPPLIDLLLAGRSGCVVGALWAGQPPPSAPHGAGSASRARAVAWARARCGLRVSVGPGSLCAVWVVPGGGPGRDRCGSAQARARVCGTPPAASVADARAVAPRVIASRLVGADGRGGGAQASKWDVMCACEWWHACLIR